MNEQLGGEQPRFGDDVVYGVATAGTCSHCGHPEPVHSDGLPGDPARLCSACRACPGFAPVESRAT